MAAPVFRGLRRDVALALSGERRRTLYETAKVLGRRSGDIQRLMRQMHDEKLIEADSPEPTQGTEYWLSKDGTAALLEEIAEGVIPGVLSEHQQLLLIKAADAGEFLGLIGRRDLAGIVGWASQLGGNGEWLLALEPRVQQVQAIRFVVSLQKLGFSCTTYRVQNVVDADELRRLSAAAEDLAERL
ncbi:MAG TPA: hypothetical protein VIJ51_13035 [Solirubrobacteraceae bacterium]